MQPDAADPSTATLRMANALARRELLPWILLGVTLGLVEGATAAVLLKQHFSGSSSPVAVNFAVSIVSGAPTMANVLSFAWANLGHARRRVPLLVALQWLFAVLVGLIGFAQLASHYLGGLLFAVLSILTARVVWAGIQTLRSSVWIANYPRNTLARVTSRFMMGNALTVAGTSLVVSLVLQSGAVDSRYLYLAAALAGVAAAFLYQRTRMRHEHRVLTVERAVDTGEQAFSLRAFRDVLRSDPAYREYMFWMGIYGGGSVMMTSQMVVILSDHLQLPSQQQVLMLAVIPMLALPIFTPFWARRFDRKHTVNFRAEQGWFAAGAYVLSCAGILAGWTPLLWCGAALLGAANAGASFGWNLGHRDFAAPERAQHYMGVHVTLTGLRGVLAPPLGMLCYQILESNWPGTGRYSIILPTVTTAVGAWGFNHLRRKHYLTLNKHAKA